MQEKDFKKYAPKWCPPNVFEMRPWTPEDHVYGGTEAPNPDKHHITIDNNAIKNGSPKLGDMVAREPKKHMSMWIIHRDHFIKNFIEVE